MSDRRRRSIFVEPLLVWAALMLLLAANAVIAYCALGPLANMAVSISIGAVMAAAIAIFSMRLRRSGGTIWLAAFAGIAFLFTLFLLTFGDYNTRPLW